MHASIFQIESSDETSDSEEQQALDRSDSVGNSTKKKLTAKVSTGSTRNSVDDTVSASPQKHKTNKSSLRSKIIEDASAHPHTVKLYNTTASDGN